MSKKSIDKNYTLEYYDSVQSVDVNWLWRPYVPYSKITILQGDPGEGKTTLMLQIAAMLSSGRSIPDGNESVTPQKVIFQSSEDGIADTIKPRLEAAGADCSNIAFIKTTGANLTLGDKVFGDAIRASGAKLLIIDPLQAFIGTEGDLLRPGGIREAFRGLTEIAEETGCAIVMISHLNKNAGRKGIYRGLGTIDVAAVARSVLMIGRSSYDHLMRVMVPIKSSLAPEGCAYGFRLDPETGFEWVGPCEYSAADILCNSTETAIGGKLERAKELLENLLIEDKSAIYIMNEMQKSGIGERTAQTAKKELGVISYRMQESWYWHLPDPGTGEADV